MVKNARVAVDGERKMCGQKVSAQRECVVEKPVGKKCAVKENLLSKKISAQKISAQRIRAVKSAVKKCVPLKSALFGATQNVVNQRKKMWSKLGAT